MIAIGSQIRKARLSKGLSQNDVADLCAIPKARLSRYENDWVVPTLETIEILAKALGVAPKTLVGWK